MDEDTLWLHLYVVLSRATTLKNLLVIRAPPADFLHRGPPRDLKQRLELFARRTPLSSLHAVVSPSAGILCPSLRNQCSNCIWFDKVWTPHTRAQIYLYAN